MKGYVETEGITNIWFEGKNKERPFTRKPVFERWKWIWFHQAYSLVDSRMTINHHYFFSFFSWSKISCLLYILHAFTWLLMLFNVGTFDDKNDSIPDATQLIVPSPLSLKLIDYYPHLFFSTFHLSSFLVSIMHRKFCHSTIKNIYTEC